MSRSALRRIMLVVLGAGSIILSVALLEAGLRTVHLFKHWRSRGLQSSVFHQASSIPGFDYEMVPNRRASLQGFLVETNQHGMRDDEPFSQKPGSPCRVAVLGDSYTFGIRVHAGETYPKVLESLLRQSPLGARCKFEVLNFGVIGYSSYDEDLMLKYRAVNFEPHVVIVGYVLNDPEVDAIQPLHAYFVRKFWWQPYSLLKMAAQVKDDWDRKHVGGGDYYIYLHIPGRRKWQSVVDAFSDIREVAEPRKIKVVVTIFPMVTRSFKGKPWSESPYTRLHRQVSDLAVSNGFAVVDLLDAFSQYPSQDLVFEQGDDHPNVTGHEVIARAIEDKLLADPSYFFGSDSAPVANGPH